MSRVSLSVHNRLEHTPSVLDERWPNERPDHVRRAVRHRMLVVLLRAHHAQRKVQIQEVGHRVIGHFPGQSHAGTDVTEQRQTVLQAGIFVQGDKNLCFDENNCCRELHFAWPAVANLPAWPLVAQCRPSEMRPRCRANDPAPIDRSFATFPSHTGYVEPRQFCDHAMRDRHEMLAVRPKKC